jgi:hypothetical protein
MLKFNTIYFEKFFTNKIINDTDITFDDKLWNNNTSGHFDTKAVNFISLLIKLFY